MPSIRARIAKYFISWQYGATHGQSPEERLEAVLEKTRVADHDTPDVLPTSITGDARYEVAEERYGDLEGGQKWLVHHVKKIEHAEREGKGQVVIYWHGGAFVNKMTSHHWNFIKTIMESTGIPFVVPHYTHAPLATAHQAILGAVSLVLSISRDPRYRDREIVLMGDSAGGWFTARTLFALTEVVLGEFGASAQLASPFDVEEAQEARRKMRKAICISGAFDMDLAATTHKEDELLQPDDPWLNMFNLRPITRLWSYGPHSVAPGHDLPPTASTLTHSDLIPTPASVALTDRLFTPVDGTDVMKRYAERNPGTPSFDILQTIGTSDILYNQNVRLHAALEGLGKDVVRAEMITEPGLFHVYPLVQFLPESQRAIAAFVDLLRGP